MADDWVLQIDLQEPQPAAPALDVLARAWSVLLASPPQTVAALTNHAGDTLALKTTEQFEVIVVPF